jgi:hypothetical protein
LREKYSSKIRLEKRAEALWQNHESYWSVENCIEKEANDTHRMIFGKCLLDVVGVREAREKQNEGSSLGGFIWFNFIVHMKRKKK